MLLDTLSGRARFDRELSAISRIDSAREKDRKWPWAVDIAPRPSRAAVTAAPVARKTKGSAGAGRAASIMRKRRRIWRLIGAERLSIADTARQLGMNRKRVSVLLQRGRPAGGALCKVCADDFAAPGAGLEKRAQIAAAINAAACRRGIPPTMVVSTEARRSCAALAQVREDACTFARGLGLSYPTIGGLLRMDHASVIHACRRAERRAS